MAEFEALYRANVAAVTAYFARRSAEPQTGMTRSGHRSVAVTLGQGGIPAGRRAATSRPRKEQASMIRHPPLRHLA